MRKVPGAELASLTALRSVCLLGQGRLSQVLVAGGSFYDPRRVKTLVQAVARYYAVDLIALRCRCREELHMRNFLPLPLSAQLVLVPLPLGEQGEMTGYVNLLALEKVLVQGEYSKLCLKGGAQLGCKLSAEAVERRLQRARLLLWELSGAGLLPTAGPGEIWRQKLELIRAILE